jgi:hypothetical protein
MEPRRRWPAPALERYARSPDLLCGRDRCPCAAQCRACPSADRILTSPSTSTPTFVALSLHGVTRRSHRKVQRNHTPQTALCLIIRRSARLFGSTRHLFEAPRPGAAELRRHAPRMNRTGDDAVLDALHVDPPSHAPSPSGQGIRNTRAGGVTRVAASLVVLLTVRSLLDVIPLQNEPVGTRENGRMLVTVWGVRRTESRRRSHAFGDDSSIGAGVNMALHWAAGLRHE